MYQGVLGRIHNKIFLINQNNPEIVDLYAYDTLSKTGAQYVRRFPRMMLHTLSRPQAFGFVGIYQQEDKLRYRYLELGENGDSLRGHEDTLALLNNRFNTLSSPDERHLLYYQCRRFNADSAWLQGTMIGVNGTVEKVLYYTFKHDKERDQEPSVFVDNSGNTHIVVYDKFDNYRISTNITINTISFADEFITSESFDLRKVKLKTMDLLEDVSAGRISAKGLYVNAADFEVQGMYNLSFPLARKNEIRPKYAPFTPEIIKSMTKNFNNQTTSQTLNQLSIEDISNTSGGTTSVFHLDPVGMYTGTAKQRSPYDETRIFQNQVNLFRVEMPTVNNLYEMEQKNADIAPSALAAGPRSTPPPSYVAADSWNAPKLVFLRTNANNDFTWHATKGQNIFSLPDPRYNYTLYANDAFETIVLLYENNDLKKADVPRPVLVSFRNGQRVTERVADKLVLFSPVQPLRDRMFGAIYYNPNNYESGIMVIQPAEK